ncbi:hypothetical protein [Arthrobacter sp. NicSoilC5]|uniref:hypothetical protein n=1 Tax=Arthrobacter sp. NicSoilC5 TaxID=2831000 RepID=UPI001CC41DAA|nr:hypothetical protein [Arthrobacter sp. NicSoilC5]BCW78323.1 hypothetical protein NicSoilC5_03420 [Arthrobacter sp. NicSoilC5]
MPKKQGKGKHQGNSEVDPKKPWWKNPVVKVLLWLLGIVAGTVGATLTGGLKPITDGVFNHFTEHGDPVAVSSLEVAHDESIWATPAGETVSADEALHMSSDDKEFFSDHHAARISPVGIRLGLQGNRAEKVRVTDLTTEQTCGPPQNGAFFEAPNAGADLVIPVTLNLDSPHPVALAPAPQPDPKLKPEPTPYFDANTVSLAKDEQVFFKVIVVTTKYHCDFRLVITVLEGSEVRKQVIDDHGQMFSITPRLPLKEFQQVYLGGVMCGTRGFHPATKVYIENQRTYPDSPCVE